MNISLEITRIFPNSNYTKGSYSYLMRIGETYGMVSHDTLATIPQGKGKAL